MSGLAPAPRAMPLDRASAEFAAEVHTGLSLPQKRLAPKFFYDERGSQLFDEICTLEEYYPTRVETEILRAHAQELSSRLAQGTALVELGSGSSVKTRLLLDALPVLGAYVPVDISAEHLQGTADRLARDYPALRVRPVAGDFTTAIRLPPALASVPKLLFFPGSTIGNFALPEAQALLRRLRALPATIGLVIGADLRKDQDRLVRAYDDARGVTAAFNLNLLARINRELGAGFDLDGFTHEARWNEAESRIEMHLVSRRPQRVTVAGRSFAFAAGESIHTEDSYKFSIPGFQALARDVGWLPAEVWTDPACLFSVHVLLPAEHR